MHEYDLAELMEIGMGILIGAEDKGRATEIVREVVAEYRNERVIDTVGEERAEEKAR